MNDKQAIKRQSKLGFISFWIGIINILMRNGVGPREVVEMEQIIANFGL